MPCRRWCCWFSLVVILSGTPAREAEAASDLARTMAERDDEGRRIEEVDGGVGDDSLEATRAASAESSGALELPGLDMDSSLIHSGVTRFPTLDRGQLAPILLRHYTPSSRRQAWLGRFLF